MCFRVARHALQIKGEAIIHSLFHLTQQTLTEEEEEALLVVKRNHGIGESLQQYFQQPKRFALQHLHRQILANV